MVHVKNLTDASLRNGSCRVNRGEKGISEKWVSRVGKDFHGVCVCGHRRFELNKNGSESFQQLRQFSTQ